MVGLTSPCGEYLLNSLLPSLLSCLLRERSLIFLADLQLERLETLESESSEITSCSEWVVTSTHIVPPLTNVCLFVIGVLLVYVWQRKGGSISSINGHWLVGGDRL